MDPFPVRRFPIRVRPQPEEALDSWLERTAARLDVSWGALLERCGLAGRLGSEGLAIHLSSQEMESLEAATAVPVDRIPAMILERYRDRALRFTPDGKVSRHVLWGRASGSRFCPFCLKETGCWRMEWRLAWVFSCTVHNCLLLERCPSCARTPRTRPYPGYHVPSPGRCSSPASGPSIGRSAPRCGFDLGTLRAPDLSGDERPRTFQQTLLEAIDTGTASFGVYAHRPIPTVEALADVKSLAARILSTAETYQNDAGPVLWKIFQETYEGGARDRAQARPGFMYPPAPATAMALTVAMGMLDTPSIAEAGIRIRELSNANGRPASPTTFSDWGRYTTSTFHQVLLAAGDPRFSPSTRIRINSSTESPIDVAGPGALPNPGADRYRWVPTLFWAEPAKLLAPPKFTDVVVRLALSVALLQTGTGLTHRELAALLQSPVGRNVTRVLVGAEAAGEWNQLSTSLARLADYLDAGRGKIDYQRRRELDYEGILPLGEWTSMWKNPNLKGIKRPLISVARKYLYVTISGSLTKAITKSARRGHGYDLRNYLPPSVPDQLKQSLTDYAQRFLMEKGIQNEPVEWSPPLRLFQAHDTAAPDKQDT
jgi:hypothetical protein